MRCSFLSLWYKLLFWDNTYLGSGVSLKPFACQRRSRSLDRMKGRAALWFWGDETIVRSTSWAGALKVKKPKQTRRCYPAAFAVGRSRLAAIYRYWIFPLCTQSRQRGFLLEGWIGICGSDSERRLGQRAWAWRKDRAGKGTGKSNSGRWILIMELFWPGRELWN